MKLRVTESAPRNLSYPYIDGRLAHGDVFEVDDEKGAALLETHDYLEEIIDVEGGVEDSDESDEDAIDPSDYTVEELREAIDGADDEVLDEIEAAERDGKNRETALEAIDAEREE